MKRLTIFKSLAIFLALKIVADVCLISCQVPQPKPVSEDQIVLRASDCNNCDSISFGPFPQPKKDTAFTKADFHVRVEPNPSHNGEVNVGWMNNWVVFVTRDNWQTKEIVKASRIYEGFDNNGTPYSTAEYELMSFRGKDEAIAYAKKFTSYFKFEQHKRNEAKTNARLNKLYSVANKNLVFGETKSEKAKSVAVY